MREETHICTVRAPQTEVWRFLSDYRNVVQLCSDTADAVLQTGTEGTTGCRYEATVRWEEIPTRFRVSLREAERPDSLEWAARTPGSAGFVRFDLAPDEDGGTRVAVTYSLAMHAGIMPLEPFGWAIISRLGERFMRQLRAVEPSVLSA